MLGKNYITINSEAIPNPTSFDIEEETIENVFQSEAGTDLSTVVRTGKVSAKGTFQVSSRWKDKLKTFSRTASATVVISGTTYTMRIRNYKAKLLEHSENVEGTVGLWTVSLDFIEV